jgi:hypothetical protein
LPAFVVCGGTVVRPGRRDGRGEEEGDHAQDRGGGLAPFVGEVVHDEVDGDVEWHGLHFRQYVQEGLGGPHVQTVFSSHGLTFHSLSTGRRSRYEQGNLSQKSSNNVDNGTHPNHGPDGLVDRVAGVTSLWVPHSGTQVGQTTLVRQPVANGGVIKRVGQMGDLVRCSLERPRPSRSTAAG